MAHVSYVEKDQADDSIRPTYDAVERGAGKMLNFLKVLAHNKALFEGFMALDGSLRTFSLPAKYRELAYLRTSAINGCEYCTHYHRIFGRKAGLSAEQLEGVGAPDAGGAFDDREREILRYSEQVTKQGRADADLITRLKGFLDDRQLVELTATVALANFTNRINDTLELELP